MLWSLKQITYFWSFFLSAGGMKGWFSISSIEPKTNLDYL